MNVKSAAFAAKTRTVKSSSGRFLRELHAHEHLSPEELASRQNGWARDIAAWAMQESPFYRRTFGQLGIDPDSLSDPDRWASLPILDRSTIKQHSAEFPTRDAAAKNVRPARTGGSTGEPLRTLHDARVPSLALSWRM